MTLTLLTLPALLAFAYLNLTVAIGAQLLFGAVQGTMIGYENLAKRFIFFVKKSDYICNPKGHMVSCSWYSK